MRTVESSLKKRLVPVAVIDRAEDAVPLAEALLAGGLNVIEVTMRTEAALDAMAAIAEKCPDMILGAGTVIDPKAFEPLADIGVKFAVSPGLNPKVVEAATNKGIQMIPGVITPSEFEQARSLGLKLLKFFPAEAAGGAKMLKAMAGPYAHTGIRFVPTGGISDKNMADYLSIPTVAAIGGSWFVAKNLVNEGKFDQITEMTKTALEIAAKI